MTQEEKAKRYDYALTKARNIVNSINVGLIGKDSFEAVFPELKESEDERVRKALINGFNKLDKSAVWYNGITNGEILAWLEKQVQKPQGKSALEASKEEKVDNANKVKPKDYSSVDPHFFKPAWSKEDEGIYQSIMDDTVQENQLNNKQTNWLRDIKYRHFPQPKQEWSEEYERIYKSIIYSFSHNYPLTVQQQDFVKSLKPQSQWKPSDEQMKILNEVLNFAANHESPHWNDCIFGILNNLIRQLKKLREE